MSCEIVRELELAGLSYGVGYRYRAFRLPDIMHPDHVGAVQYARDDGGKAPFESLTDGSIEEDSYK